MAGKKGKAKKKSKPSKPQGGERLHDETGAQDAANGSLTSVHQGSGNIHNPQASFTKAAGVLDSELGLGVRIVEGFSSRSIGEARGGNDFGLSAEVDQKAGAGGDRDREKDRDRDKAASDECHNGQWLGGSQGLRQAAERKWVWLGFTPKQFKAFTQEFAPVLGIGLDEVRARIEDIKCRSCRDRLLRALDRGVARGGFPLTKVVKLTACSDSQQDAVNEDALSSASNAKEDKAGAGAGVRAREGMKSSECSGGEGRSRVGGGSSKLAIRAPLSLDLLKQVAGMAQAAVAREGSGALGA
ncbi:unnamed protein product, partial [Discosporangium mesarthrocarpum]